MYFPLAQERKIASLLQLILQIGPKNTIILIGKSIMQTDKFIEIKSRVGNICCTPHNVLIF